MNKPGERGDHTEIPRVRQTEAGSNQGDLHVIRIKIRLDHYPTLGEVDFSFIAWEHPGAFLLRNELWSHYDRAHAGMAALDMVAMTYSAIRVIPDPFP